MSHPASGPTEFAQSLRSLLQSLYSDHDAERLFERVTDVYSGMKPRLADRAADLWSASDCVLITYGDSIRDPDAPPLQTLHRFLTEHIGDLCTAVHVLPFFPWSSDDGFAVIDYCQVDPKLGDWDDLRRIADRYRLMADLVINHVSSQSQWFLNYVAGKNPGADYFIEISESDDLSQVVRPRASALMRPTPTSDGFRQLWCTFSHDQVDLNFRNPEVLIEFLKILRVYLGHGVSILRLDAVGFLWKEPGTSCMHLRQTHEVIRLIRAVVDHFAPGTIVITETNVPNHENLSYFGNRNEAHVVYNFSLAPLIVHALLTGETRYLKRWMMSMPPAPAGCTYLNFTASHDGIGMRPAEGLLSEQEQAQMVEAIGRFGGRVSTRRSADGGERVYELNISLFDAMQGTIRGPDRWQTERFLCSQTVMMAVEGIPAFYIHSLLATPNDEAAVRQTGHNRSINRQKLDYAELERQLADESSVRARVLNELARRLEIRRSQPAFHPNATQFTLQLGEPFFAFWRQSRDREQSIFAVHNMTSRRRRLRLADLNLIALDRWYDLLSGDDYDDQNATIEVAPYQCLWITNRESREVQSQP